MSQIVNYLFQRKHIQQCENCDQNQSKRKRIIEITRGKPQDALYDADANAVKTSKYKILNFFPRCLLIFFTRQSNFVFLIISIIMLSADSVNPFNNWIIIIPLGIFFIIFMIKELWLDLRRKDNDDYQNYNVITQKLIVDRKTFLQNQNNSHQSVYWKQLKPGDMIWLEQDDQVPADIIFLDSNEIRDREAICFIDTYNVNGLKQKVKKKGLSQTTIQSKDHPQKLNFQERRKTLNARIEYEMPNADLDHFRGYFRKKTDTKTEVLTNDNFIPRGSVIKTQTSGGWVLGLVVYSGMDTKIMINSKYSTIKFPHTYKMITSFFYWTFLLTIILSLISIILFTAKTKDYFYLRSIDAGINNGKKLFQYIILYSILIPVSIYGYLDIIQILSIPMLENWMNKLSLGTQQPRSQKIRKSQSIYTYVDDFEEISISDPNPLSNLGHINYMVVDNSLCTGEFVIDNLLVHNYLFRWKWSNCKEQLKEQDEFVNKSNDLPKSGEENHNIVYESSGSKQMTQIKESQQEIIVSPGRIFSNKGTARSMGGGGGDKSSYIIGNDDRHQNIDVPMFFDKHQQKFGDIYSKSHRNMEQQIKVDNIILEENDQISEMSKSDLSKKKLKIENLGNNTSSFEEKSLIQDNYESENALNMEYKEEDPRINLHNKQTQQKSSETQFYQKLKDPAYYQENGNDNKNGNINYNNGNEIQFLKNFQQQNKQVGPPLTTLFPIDLKENKVNNEVKYIETLKKINSDSDFSSAEYCLDWLLHGVMLCHEAVENGLQDNVNWWSVKKEEEEILRFASLCGYKYLARPTFNQLIPLYNCKVRGNEKSFKVLGLNNSTKVKQRVSVIVQEQKGKSRNQKNQEESLVIMFCKGDIEFMLEPGVLRLNQQEKSNIKELKQDMEAHSIRPIVYAFKILTQKEAQSYEQEYLALKNHPNSQQEELEKLALKMEKDLNFLGAIGLKDELIAGAKDFVKFTQKTNINTWMLTGDNEKSTTNIAQNLHIIQSNQDRKLFEIDTHNLDDINDQIKKILAEMKSCISPEEEQDYDQPQVRKQSQSHYSYSVSPKQTSKSMNNQNSPTFKFNQNDISKSLKAPDIRHLKNYINNNLNFAFDQQNMGQYQLKDTINTFKWCLKLNGNSLSLIQRDNYLLQHFVFIISFCKHLIAYELNPGQKAFIIQLAKQNFMFNPTFCSIGDGFNDTLMMQASDISFELRKEWCVKRQVNNFDNIQEIQSNQGSLDGDKEENESNNNIKNFRVKEVIANGGDIVVNSVDQIQRIIIEKGQQLYFCHQNVIFFMFYLSILMGCIIFFFNWYALLLGYQLFESNLIFLYIFVFNFGYIIAIGLYDTNYYSPYILQNLPALYMTGQQEKNKYYLNFILQSVSEALVHAVIIFYISAYSMAHATLSDGYKMDLGIYQLFVFYTISVVINFRVFLQLLSRKCHAGFIAMIYYFLLLFIYIFFNNNQEEDGKKRFDNWDTVIYSRYIFTNYECFMIFIFIIMGCLGSSYIIREIISYYLFPSVTDEWQQVNVQFNSKDQIEKQNYVILKESFTRTLNIGKLVKKIFQQSEGVDTSIQEMLNTGDINLAEMRLNKFTLKMISKKLEKQYMKLKKKTSKQYFQFIYALCFCVFFLWSMLSYFLKEEIENNGEQNTYDSGYLNDIDKEDLLYCKIALLVLFTGFFIWTFSKKFLSNYYIFGPILLLLAVLSNMFLTWMTSNMNISLVSALVSVITTFNFNFSLINTILINILNSLNYLTRILFLYYYSDWNVENGDEANLIIFYSSATFFILLVFIAAYSVYLIYRTDKQKRSDYIANDQVKQEKAKSDEIKQILLPKFVSDILNSGNDIMEDEQPRVGILFCYIKDFPDINRSEKKRVVQYLDEMYRKFDELCIQFGVQKYETQGPSYLAVAGIKQCENDIPNKLKRIDKCVRLVQMAFAMKRVAGSMSWGFPNQRPFQIKIGINEGEVIAGIIGWHKKQFCLVGDAVNIAQRTTSKGQGDINVKDNVYEIIKQSYNNEWYFERKEVEMQGVEGKVGVYIVDDKPNQKMQRASSNYLKILKKYKEAKKQGTLSQELRLKMDGRRSLYKKKTFGGFRMDHSKLNEYQQKQIIEHQKIKAQFEEKPSGLSKKNSTKKMFTRSKTLKTKIEIADKKKKQEIKKQKQRKSRKSKPNNQMLQSVFNNSDDDDENLSEQEEQNDQKNQQDDEGQTLNFNKFLMLIKDKIEPNAFPHLNELMIKENNLNYQMKLKEFNSWLKDISQNEGKVMLMLLILVYLALTLFLVTIRIYIDGGLSIFYIRGIFVALVLICALFYDRAYVDVKYSYFCFFTFLYGSVPSLLQAYYSDKSGNEDISFTDNFRIIQILEQSLIFITSSNLAIFGFLHLICICITQNVLFFLFYGLNAWLYLDFIIYWVCLNLFILMKHYTQTKQNYTTFNNLVIKEIIKKRQDKYVSQLMPQHIILRMKNINSLSENKMSSVDEFEMVSVLQADIKGFTAYSNQMQNPRACVQLLQRLYEGFDRLCVEYNLFKLYTVGDCYVVLGFNNANKRGPQTYQQEAYNLTKMGLEMIKHIEQVKAEIKFDQLGMRVGIHTGTIVGGIIGTEVVRYDIYGKDAYITALMESEGFEEIMKNGEVIKKVNQLHISEKTKELLEKNNKQHNFEFRQHLDLDGKVAEIDISKYTKDDPEEPQNMKGYFVKEIHK